MPAVSWPFLSLLWTTTSLRSPVHSSLEGQLAWSGSHCLGKRSTKVRSGALVGLKIPTREW